VRTNSREKRGAFHGYHHRSLPSLKDATLWCAMVMHPMVNSSIAAVPVDGKAVRNRLPTPMPKRAARRSCMQAQERSSLRGLTRTFGVSRTTVSNWIKKRSSASSLTDHPACTGSRRSRFYDPGTGRALVVCAQKSIRLLDLGCPLPQDTTGGRLCRG